MMSIHHCWRSVGFLNSGAFGGRWGAGEPLTLMDLISNGWNPTGKPEFLPRTGIDLNSLDLFIAPDLSLI